MKQYRAAKQLWLSELVELKAEIVAELVSELEAEILGGDDTNIPNIIKRAHWADHIKSPTFFRTFPQAK